LPSDRRISSGRMAIKNDYLDKARQANVELGLKLGRGE